MLSPLRPLRFDKSPKQKIDASDYFAPEYGAEIGGTPYQGGEKLPQDVVQSLNAKDRRLLTTDPTRAAQDLLERPAYSKGELKGDKKKGIPPKQILRIGKDNGRLANDYSVPPGVKKGNQAPQSPEEGRSRLPSDLSSPDLVTDEEAMQITPRMAHDVVDMFNRLDEHQMHAAAKAGVAKRGWYKSAAKSLVSLFGPEAGRFVALLAATSPQVPVKRNLEFAASLWAKWTAFRAEMSEKGKEPTYADTRKWLDQMHNSESDKVTGLMDTTHNNIALALVTDDPGNLTKEVLSGPKVDSFRRNLLGNLQAVTNDVWMSYLLNFDQEEIAGKNAKEHPFGAKTPSGGVASFKKLNGQYLANNILARKVARRLSEENPNEAPWTPAEVQETAWSFFRALCFIGGKSRRDGKPMTPIEALHSLTHADVADNADFVSLLFKRNPDGTKNSIISNLERAGLGKSLVRIFRQHQKEQKASKAVPTGSVLDALSSNERQALTPVARRAGQHVRGFMTGTAEYARRGRPLRFAATQAPQAMPMPVAPQAPAMPQAQNPVQAPPQGAGPPPIDEHRENLLAFSPNVDDLSFEDALVRARSGNHKAFKKIVQHINEQVGLKAHLQDAIGDWSDGAENSILQRIDDPVDPKTVDYLASWYGLLANQKAVLAFTPSYNGLDSVYQIELPQTDLGQVRKSLDKAGIPFRTLIPSKKGTRVVIYDEQREMRDRVAAWAGAHNASIRESIGQGRFIGGPTRTAARAKYRKVITAYESAAAKSGGQVRAYRPPVQPNHLRSESDAKGPVKQARRGARLRFSAESLPPLPPDKHDTLGDIGTHIHRAIKGFLEGMKDTGREMVRKIKEKPRRRKFAAVPIAGQDEVKRRLQMRYAMVRSALVEAARRHPKDRAVRGLVRASLNGDVSAFFVLRDRLEELGDPAGGERLMIPDGAFSTPWKEAGEALLHHSQGVGGSQSRTPHVDAFLSGQAEEGTGATPTPTFPPQSPGKMPAAQQDVQSRTSRMRAALNPELRGDPNYEPKVKFSGVQAPAGGVVVRGLFYPGGKWIPSANLEKANYDQYQHVENQRAMKQKYQRRPDGSVSVDPALASEGADEEKAKYAKNYTPGVDPRVEKIRSILGRGGKAPQASGPSRTSTLKGIGQIGGGLKR